MPKNPNKQAAGRKGAAVREQRRAQRKAAGRKGGVATARKRR